MLIEENLINFIFETDDLMLEKLDPQITNGQYELIIGKERFERLTALAQKSNNDSLEKINVSDIELEDLIFIYYNGDINNKSIESIENEFKIKKLLE